MAGLASVAALAPSARLSASLSSRRHGSAVLHRSAAPSRLRAEPLSHSRRSLSLAPRAAADAALPAPAGKEERPQEAVAEGPTMLSKFKTFLQPIDDPERNRSLWALALGQVRAFNMRDLPTGGGRSPSLPFPSLPFPPPPPPRSEFLPGRPCALHLSQYYHYPNAERLTARAESAGGVAFRFPCFLGEGRGM